MMSLWPNFGLRPGVFVQRPIRVESADAARSRNSPSLPPASQPGSGRSDRLDGWLGNVPKRGIDALMPRFFKHLDGHWSNVCSFEALLN